MNALLWLLSALMVLSVPSAMPQPVEGKLVYYGQGVMERVYAKRVAQGLTPAGWAGVLTTSPWCDDIGDVVLLSVWNPRTKTWGNYERALVVDCSQPADRARHIAQGLREVGYPTAQKYGFVERGATNVRVITR